MKLNSKSWREYVNKLSAINERAGDLMREYIAKNGTDDMQALIRYAYAVSTKYGEAAGALACEMYDLTASAYGAIVAPAEPAPTATYTETAIAVSGAKMQGDAVVSNAVERLVKLVGEDTTLYNARRDGAETAWIPSGDTCGFCIMLASNGWQHVPRKRRKPHAEHIHAHCDCAHAVRFNGVGEVGGYDPDEYLEKFYSAGTTPEERINTMRREHYAENKDAINEQKRIAYAKRKELEKG